jgi:transposase InsO family protein
MPHTESDSKTAKPLQLVHSGVMGQFTPALAGGNLCLLAALRDFSGHAAMRPVKHKSEATLELKKIMTAWKRQTEWQVKAVQTDSRKEYAAFDRWCNEECIRRERAVPYTPQQNGRVERLNRAVTGKGIAMLMEAGREKKY